MNSDRAPGLRGDVPNDALAQRFERIETKIGFAEDALEELNHLVFRQQEQISKLQKQLLAVSEQLASVRMQGGRDLRDDIPPHY